MNASRKPAYARRKRALSTESVATCARWGERVLTDHRAFACGQEPYECSMSESKAMRKGGSCTVSAAGSSIAERGGSQMVEHRARPSGETGRKRLQERADAGERRAGVLESLCAAGSTVNRRSAGQLPGILGQQCKQVEWCAGAICGASIAVVRQ